MRIAAACAVLVAAFVGALLVGRGGSQEKADPPAEVKAIKAPTGGVDAPRLADTGKLPDLHETPVQSSSSSGTSSTGTSQTSTSTPSTGSTGSTGATGGGGGSPSPQVRPPG